MEIAGEDVFMIGDFLDLVELINELFEAINYFDKEKVNDIKYVNEFIS